MLTLSIWAVSFSVFPWLRNCRAPSVLDGVIVRVMDYRGIPAALRPPVSLALAEAVAWVPGPDALPGGLVFEPKWDGFLHCTLSTRLCRKPLAPSLLLRGQTVQFASCGN
jgi:hypothetical protein